MRRAVIAPNFWSTPADFVEFAREVEQAGWDGLFVYDHLQFLARLELEVWDPWVLLAGAAVVTDRILLGTGVTPVSRRTPWKLAKEVLTLDHLSAGRAVLGVGLGGPDEDEFVAFGDDTSVRERAERTDEALPIIDAVLRGEALDHEGRHHRVRAHLRPASVARPRPPIWVAATPFHRRPLERAQQWDGVFCNLKIESDVSALTPAEITDYVGHLTGRADFDVVTARNPDHTAAAYEAAGVSWLLEGTQVGPNWLDRARDTLLAGPSAVDAA